MSQMWDIYKDRREPGGHCGGKKGWCGYCGACDYIWNIGKYSNWKGMTKAEWQEMNYKNNLKSAMREKLRIQEVKDAVMIEAGGGLKHTFWTIALPKDYDLGKMQEKTEELINKDKYGMGKSCAVYEYHSETCPNGGNLHIHILVPEHGKKTRAGKQIEMVAKHYGIKENFVDRELGIQRDFKNRMNYVLGRKINDEKQKYVEEDRKWRAMQDLPDFASTLSKKVEEAFKN